jgi:quercetin dioxygenase-like cupin family protein
MNFKWSLETMPENVKKPVVLQRDECAAGEWACGEMRRVVTGGVGGVANVHVAKTKRMPEFFHTGYDEIYYVLAGSGTIRLDGKEFSLRPGSVAVIPAGTRHALVADEGEELEFVVFGSPPMSIEDERAKPRRA